MFEQLIRLIRCVGQNLEQACKISLTFARLDRPLHEVNVRIGNSVVRTSILASAKIDSIVGIMPLIVSKNPPAGRFSLFQTTNPWRKPSIALTPKVRTATSNADA